MPTYCTADEVAAFLQLDSSFSTSTKPTLAEVEAMIERNEDVIDAYTGHAWRETTIVDEYHDVHRGMYEVGTGLPVWLRHRKIKTFDSSQGDKIEIWNGSDWEDWLQTKQEGRDKDWWCEYENGILYLKSRFSWTGMRARIRVTYRYGEDSVDKEIKKACILLTACDLIMNEGRSVMLPSGEVESVRYADRVDRWKEEAMEILRRKQEWLLLSR